MYFTYVLQYISYRNSKEIKFKHVCHIIIFLEFRNTYPIMSSYMHAPIKILLSRQAVLYQVKSTAQNKGLTQGHAKYLISFINNISGFNITKCTLAQYTGRVQVVFQYPLCDQLERAWFLCSGMLRVYNGALFCNGSGDYWSILFCNLEKTTGEN